MDSLMVLLRLMVLTKEKSCCDVFFMILYCSDCNHPRLWDTVFNITHSLGVIIEEI